MGEEQGSGSEEQTLSLEQALKLAIGLQRQRRLDDAEKIYRSILEAFPEQADALHYLGVVQHQRGQPERAIALIRRAVTADPRYRDAYNNLGNVYKESGRLEEAEAAYRKVIELDPENPSAHNNLGALLRATGRAEAALEHLQRAAALAPGDAAICVNLGNALAKLDRLSDAVASYRKALTLQPYNDEAYERLCQTLYIAGETDEVRKVLAQWLEYDPDNPIARHNLAALTGEQVPERASDAYVRQTFDGFAGSFDRVLKEIGYQAPALVTAAIAAAVGEPRQALEVLDAGCGTGLCGASLRPYARRLIGIDLSAAMLDKARGRNAYDELVEAELTEYLQAHPARFDLIASADTLVYFGELAPVLQAAAGSLRKRGFLVFTLEKADTAGDDGFRLNPHGRYSHTERYVRVTLADAGLELHSIEEKVLRMERGEEVKGLLVTARRT